MGSSEVKDWSRYSVVGGGRLCLFHWFCLFCFDSCSFFSFVSCFCFFFLFCVALAQHLSVLRIFQPLYTTSTPPDSVDFAHLRPNRPLIITALSTPSPPPRLLLLRLLHPHLRLVIGLDVSVLPSFPFFAASSLLSSLTVNLLFLFLLLMVCAAHHTARSSLSYQHSSHSLALQFVVVLLTWCVCICARVHLLVQRASSCRPIGSPHWPLSLSFTSPFGGGGLTFSLLRLESALRFPHLVATCDSAFCVIIARGGLSHRNPFVGKR